MIKVYKSIFSLCFVFMMSQLSAQSINMKHLSSYSVGEEGNCETVAYNYASKQMFFTSSANNSFSIVDIADPLNPKLVKEVSLAEYGGGPNSIDCSNFGDVESDFVAIAMEAGSKQENGQVVLFDMTGTAFAAADAGALPDMVAISPDGNLLMVANEGEPSDDYSIDPEGSIMYLDGDGNVELITFEGFNDRRQELINKGIRIFGNNGSSTVAQDLEPEYIAFSEDSKYAYVNCQENNALVVIDVAEKSVLDILPLGFKDHSAGTPSMKSMINVNEIENWPSLGTPAYGGGQDPVMLGGFSGLFYAEDESSEETQVYYVVPDRGPNDSPVKKAGVEPAVSQNLRPFKLPNYQGRIAKISVTNGVASLEKQILLTRKDGQTPISGKGNIPGYDEVPVTYTDADTEYKDTSFVKNGVAYHALPYDEFGGDFEGILIDKEGNFWMCDEYRPAIYKFAPNGTLIERFVAKGASALGDSVQPEGTYGKETLPEVYNKRRANRGFEAIAYDADKNVVYAFIQSPLYNPDKGTKNNSDVIRVLGIDAANGEPVEEYVYLLESNKNKGYAANRVDKIGDAVYTGNGKFLVIERDSEGPTNAQGKKYIFEVNLVGATNLLSNEASDMALETMTADELVAAGIRSVHKTKVLNLPSVGYVSSDKAEGIALLPNGDIAVMNDNDFGLAGAGITDNSVLGIITFGDNYGFDASNKDDKINITNHPTLGMFQPDAIATYTVDSMTYIVTANEGDSRDYDGYSEEVRVKDLTLDPIAYPNAEELQKKENLGRLKTTTATGDYDGDGDIDQIYSYGARSFSIFDQYGNLVYDSGDMFGRITAENEPDLFNEDEGEVDGRSDDKGVEPEAVAVGNVEGNMYAFIGLERQSGIMVYDITNPRDPMFVTYYNNRSWEDGKVTGDVAPEIIKFIPASQSPNGEYMIAVGYEVSGSVALIQLTDIDAVSDVLKEAQFSVYPNPISKGEVLKLDRKISGDVYDINGNKVRSMDNVDRISTDGLSNGMYIIKSNLGVQRFVKL